MRLLGKAGAQPARAGGEFGVFIWRIDQAANRRGGGLRAEFFDGRAGCVDSVEEGGLRGRPGVEAD